MQAAVQGEAPPFKLRLTLLGDGNSALSVSWLHILVDGELLHNSWRFASESMLKPDIVDCYVFYVLSTSAPIQNVYDKQDVQTVLRYS